MVGPVRVSPGVYRQPGGQLTQGQGMRRPQQQQPRRNPAAPVENYANRFNANKPGSVLNTDMRFANPNTSTPYGNTATTVDKNGNVTNTSALSPEQQALYNQQLGLSGQANAGAADSMNRAGAHFASGYSVDHVPGLQTNLPPMPGNSNLPGLSQWQDPRAGQQALPGFQDPRAGQQALPGWQDPRGGVGAMPNVEAINQQGYNAAMGTYDRRTQPLQQQEQRNLEQHLMNKGLQPGSELWGSEMQRLSRQHSDANLDQQDRAILMGNQMAQSLYNQGMGVRQQGYNENFQSNDQRFNQGLQGNDQRFNQNFLAGQEQFSQGLQANDQRFNQNFQAGDQQFGQSLQGRQQMFNEGAFARSQGFNENLQSRQQGISEYKDWRYAPMNEANMMAQMGGLGVRDPNFQPYQPVNSGNAISVDQFNRTPKGPSGSPSGSMSMPTVDPMSQLMLMNQLGGMMPSQQGQQQSGSNGYQWLGGLAGAFGAPLAQQGGAWLGNQFAG